MTNEEAVERIKTIRWEHAINPCPDRTALTMAIKALEDKGYEQGYKDGYAKGYEEGVVLG